MASKKPQGNTQGVINRDVNAALRAERAIQLRAKRLTFAVIAQQCGYASAGAARNAIVRELERRMSGAVDQWRREALNELDHLQSAIWDRATDNDVEHEDADGKKRKGASLFAQDRVLAIIQERNKLLGLYPKDEQSQMGAQVFIRAYPPEWTALVPSTATAAATITSGEGTAVS